MKKTFLKAILALAASFAFVFTSCSVDSSHDSPPNTHTVKFMNGDVVYETQTVEDGETATKPETDPTKEGFTFLDWYKDGEPFYFTTPIKEDITLTAEWQDPNKEYVTVTFKNDDGSEIATKKIEKGQKVSKPADPTKSGHTFDGWYTESRTKFDFNTPINEDITLTAKWNVASVPVKSIKITGAESVAKGGSVRLSATVTPSDATNKAILWSVKQEAEGVTVANGTVTVSADCAANSVIIRAVSAADESVSDEHTLRIIDVSAINAGITITKEEGWLESSYIEWSKATSDEIDGYNVYVREAGEADDKYVKLDDMLVRAYSNTAGGTTIDYYRADALGLKAGTYQMKVVGTASGIEAENVYAESKAITVEAHDRSGFAFVNGTASGAYKEDGTLKDGAIILYVTNENWQTVSVTYSGTTVTGIDKILGEGYQSKKGATKPLCVRIIGSIGNGNKLGFKAGGDLEMKALTQDQGVTIEGVGNDATANGWGLHITTASNVEVRNLAFMEMQGTTKDGVSIESDCDHIWVHNCDFFYGHNWGGDQKKGDGSLDTKGSTNITHSYNHFWDSGKCNLQGMEKATDSGTYEITYHHNWYDHSDSRHPRIRRASVHIYNNYFDGNAKYGVGVTNGASAFVENNYFRSTAKMKPMLSSMQGTDIAHGKDGQTFSGENGGMIKAYGNKFDGNKELLTQNDTDSDNLDCYLASSRNEQVSSTYKTKLGGTTYNNFDTASGFYTYTPDTPEDAKANVEKYAGRMNGGDLHYTFNNAVEDSNYDIIPDLANKIKNYASKLVKAMGSSSAGGGDGDGDGNEDDVPTEPTPPSATGSAVISFAKNGVASDNRVTDASSKEYKPAESYGGNTYSYGAKLNSTGKFTLTLEKEYAVTFVLGTDKNVNGLNIDGKVYEVVTDTNVVKTTLSAGAHVVKQNSGETSVFLIILE